jgi:pyruvate dehydrogenase E2 component (dihydrolipoamide acetyltransferase)
MARLRAFTMPKWGIEMIEGVVGEWSVKPGQSFDKGDLIALIESDKITNEVDAEESGFVARLVAKVGDTHPVGALLAVFADDAATDAEVDAFVAAFKAPSNTGLAGGATLAAPAPSAAPAPKAAVISADANISPAARSLAERTGIDISAIVGSGRNGRITLQDVEQGARPAVAVGSGRAVEITPPETIAFASPLAVRLAQKFGVNLSTLQGTGLRGRISKLDVLAVAKPMSSATAVTKLSPMRKAIARRLTKAKTEIPHIYLRNSVRVDALLSLRERRGKAESVTDYLVRAVALALKQHPAINTQFVDDEILTFANADVSVAVATDKGLLTPIVFAADTKSVADISKELKELAAAARTGKLKADAFEGGSFSVTNLGMYGVESFDAIINPPQTAILAVGSAVRRPVETNYALSFATVIDLTLSCDHRVIDGAAGAQFLATLKSLIESPEHL